MLLAGSLLPTEVGMYAGLERAHAASLRVGLAVAGLSMACGYLIALLLNTNR